MANPIVKGKSRLHYIPWGLFIFFPLSFLLCYCIAVGLSHINAFFAFVSDAGTLPPEQNVFAQLVNMGAALFAFFVYIRFKQIEHYFRLFHQKSHHILNIIAVAFGLISALGMSIVGNFPELIQMYVHLFGAFLAFVGGSIYIVFQGYFTFKMLPHFSSKFTAYFRTFLGIFAMMMYFGAHTALIMAFEKTSDITRYEKKGMELLKWDPSDKGYSYRAASVIMEWFIVAMFNAFIVSFVSEFKKFSMEEPQCKFLAVEGDIEEDQKENEDQQGQGDTEGTIYTDDFTVDDDDADEETRATPVVYSEEVLNFKGVVVV